MINEKIMVIAGNGHPKPRQATWWLVDGQWKCVGATKPLSSFVQWISPEEAGRLAKSQGYRFSWVERYNPNINPPKPATDTAACLSQGQQSNQRGTLNTHTDEGAGMTLPTVRGNSPAVATVAHANGTAWPTRAEHSVKAL